MIYHRIFGLEAAGDLDSRLIHSSRASSSTADMSGLVSDEVAEDYKNSLEDLTTNDRFQISNLTVIAKENTEHAMAISRVLENHIRSVGVLVFFWLSGLGID